MFPLHDDNPTDVRPVVTWAILIACITLFLWQSLQSAPMQQAIVYALGVIPAVLFDEAVLPADLHWVSAEVSVITSMFLHGGWMHLIGNLLFLWVFGNNVEAAMGHVRFAVFYLLCGVAAVLAQSLPDTASQVPMIGASGAISGVLGAYLLLFPQARVLVVVPIFIVFQLLRIPALFVLGLWFLMQLFSSLLAGDAQSGVAFGAHVGGFVAGMALIPLFRRRDFPLHLPFVHFHPFRRR